MVIEVIFLFLVIFSGLVLHMMLGGDGGNQGVHGGGGNQGVHGGNNIQRINFRINNPEINVVHFEIDFSELGRHPFLRRRLSDRLFMDNIIYHRICAAVMQNYDFVIRTSQQRLTDNGWACDDDDNPVRLDVTSRSEYNNVFETSLLIYHSNLYGYCFRGMGSWQIFSDSPYNLVDENGNSVSTNLGLNAAYIVDCFNSVGVSSIINALRQLNTRNSSNYTTKWKQSALHLCFCFIEATRFTDVYFLVRYSLWRSFLNGEYYHQVPVQSYYNRVVHSWGSLNSALADFDNTGVWSSSQEDKDALGFSGEDDEQVAWARRLISVRIQT